MLSRLRNWCKNARFNPGFVCGGGTDDVLCPSIRRAALGGLRKSRLCASNVVGFVGYITTLEVEFRYGTKMTLEPSLPRRPEFLRRRFLSCALLLALLFHHL